MRFLGLAASLLLIGCAARPTEPPKQPPSAREIPPANADLITTVNALVPMVADMRGLAVLRPIEITALDDTEFDQAFASHMRRIVAGISDATGAKAGADTNASIYLGFYDYLGSRRIIVRRQMPKWFTGDPRPTLAHEIVHALQDQHFDLRRVLSFSTDARRAWGGLIEGDAQLIATGMEAKLQGKPARRTMVSAVDQDLDVRYLAKLGLVSPELMKMEPVQQRLSLFPYVDGLRFASTLFHAGGFALIDEAFANPPTGTNHVLHPEQFVAGVRSVPFKAFALPRGAVSEISESFGELGVDSFLHGFLPKLHCEKDPQGRYAEGWRGDFVQIYKNDLSYVVSLRTAWDSTARADKFEQLIRMCISDVPSGSAFVVKRRGNQVIVIVADDAINRRSAVALSIAETPAVQPSNEPRMHVTQLPPTYVALEKRMDRRGRMDGTTYVSDWLGIQVPITGAEKVSVSEEYAQLSVTWPGLVGNFLISNDTSETSMAQVRTTFVEAAVHSFQTAGITASAKPTLVKAPVLTPLGWGLNSEWTIVSDNPNVQLRLQLLNVSACHNSMSYVFMNLARTGGEVDGLSRWIRGFRVSPNSQACKEFEHEAQNDL